MGLWFLFGISAPSFCFSSGRPLSVTLWSKKHTWKNNSVLLPALANGLQSWLQKFVLIAFDTLGCPIYVWLFCFIIFLAGLFSCLKLMFTTFRLACKSSSELPAGCHGLQQKLGQNTVEVNRTAMDFRSILKYCHFDIYFKTVSGVFCSSPGIIFRLLKWSLWGWCYFFALLGRHFTWFLKEFTSYSASFLCKHWSNSTA